MATQLRRYEVESYVDRENSQFVWSVSHPGDYDAALAEYNDSPERAAAFEGFISPVTKMHLSMVDSAI